MNTNPDETKLALWLDDELKGGEHAAMEAWAQNFPEHLAAREEIRSWRKTMATTLPSDEELPYADFFNARIAREIREQSQPQAATGRTRYFFWKQWALPLAACAGIVLAFWLGTQSNTRTSATPPAFASIPAVIPKAAVVQPIVYTPENGVNAECFTSQDASATVIVLNGIAAIPDDTNFADTAILEGQKEINSTAEFTPHIR